MANVTNLTNIVRNRVANIRKGSVPAFYNEFFEPVVQNVAAAVETEISGLVGELVTALGFGSKAGKTQELCGQSITSVIRWMAKKGWSFEEAKECLVAAGVVISDTTIRCQLAVDENGTPVRGKPARITKEQAADLLALV